MCVISSAALGVASLVTGILGTGLSVYSAYNEGKTQQQYYNAQAQIDAANARIADNNARREEQAGLEDARMQRIKTIQLIGQQQTAMAANGIDVTNGTALDVIDDTRSMGELDALNILSQSERSAQNFRQQASNFNTNSYFNSAAAKNAFNNGIWNAAGNAVSGLGSTALGLGKLNKINNKWQRIPK